MVPELQVGWIPCQWQEQTRTIKKVRKWRFSGSFAWRFGPNARIASDITQHHPESHFSSTARYRQEEIWVSYKLPEHNKNKEKQLPKSCLIGSIISDEKWEYYHNSKCTKSWENPEQPATSIAKPNIHRKKILLCIWWDSAVQPYPAYSLDIPSRIMTWRSSASEIIKPSQNDWMNGSSPNQSLGNIATNEENYF